MWQRYRPLADELTVIGRSQPLAADESASKLVSSNTNGVSFCFVPDLGSPKARLLERGKVRAIIQPLLEKADCLIARLPSFTANEAIHVANKLGKPYAVEMVGCPWDALWNYGNLKGRIAAPISYLQTKQSVANAAFTIYVTKAFLQQRYPCPGVCEYASNVEIPTPSPNILQQRLNKKLSDKIVFGQIGYLDNKYKGIQVAMQALSSAKEQLGDFEFHILGSGKQEPWLQLAESLGIAHQVKLEGTLSGAEAVNAWLDKLDIFLQPSLTEGLPRALVEAMARACPALASDVGGIPELLHPDCLHPAQSANKLSENMLRMATDESWRVQQMQRNFEHAKNYSSDILNERRNAFWASFADYVKRLNR